MKISTIRARVLAPTALLGAVIASLLTHGHAPTLGAEFTADDRWGLANVSRISQMDDRWGAGRSDVLAMDDRWGAGRNDVLAMDDRWGAGHSDVLAMDDRWGAGRNDVLAMDDRWGAGRQDAGPGNTAKAAPVRIPAV